MKEEQAARVSSVDYAASLGAESVVAASRVPLNASIFTIMSINQPCNRKFIWANTPKRCPALEEFGESVIVNGLATDPHALLAISSLPLLSGSALY
jgi:hypothetical protein